MQLTDLKLSENPLILIAGLRKKPNIGCMLRTADAANLDAVIVANPKVTYTVKR
jgi:TrmH family RNA methyltransferase